MDVYRPSVAEVISQKGTMSASNLNLLNAVTLISMGLWGYVETDSFTALIPVVFGVVFVLCQRGVKNENKAIAHVAVLFTLLLLVALVGMRLPKSLATGGAGLMRVVLMIATSTLSMVGFVRSFIAARKARENG